MVSLCVYEQPAYAEPSQTGEGLSGLGVGGGALANAGRGSRATWGVGESESMRRC